MREIKKEEEESMSDILSSIRQLVYPSASETSEATIIDLTRPVDERAATSLPGIEEAASALSSFQESLKRPGGASKSIGQKSIDDFLTELIMPSLTERLDSVISLLVEKEARVLLPALLGKWMEEHLSAIVIQCVEKRLEDMQKEAQQRHVA